MSIFKRLFLVLHVSFFIYAKAQVQNPYLDSSSTWYEMFGGYAPPVYTYLEYNTYYFDGGTYSETQFYFKNEV